MSDDVLDRLRHENPVPGSMPSLPIEPILRRLGDGPHRAPTRRRPRLRMERFAAGISVLVALAVGGLAFALLGNHQHAAKPSSGASPQALPDVQSAATLNQLLDSFAVLRRPQTKADRSLSRATRELLDLYERRGGQVLPSLTRRVATLGNGDPVLLIVERSRFIRNNRLVRRYSLSFLLAMPHGAERVKAGYFPVLLRPGVWATVVPDGVAKVKWNMSSSSGCKATHPRRCAGVSSFSVDLAVRGNVAVVRPPVVIGCAPAECSTVKTSQVSWYDTSGNEIATLHMPSAAAASTPVKRLRTPVNGTLTVYGKGIAQIDLSTPDHNRLPTGSAEISHNGRRYAVMVVAGGLSPATGHSVYALWLTGGPGKTVLLGIVKPGVGVNGHRLDAAGPVPADALSYQRLAITLERSPHPTHPGPVILEGSLPKQDLR
jgi:Anti-sigma-K factor rskA